jgi:Glycosyltransferase family 9 (heptosyltransferase)
MHRIFLLRAYGDFVIFLHAITKSSKKEQYSIVASKHLEPLYDAIKTFFLLENIQIDFVNFELDKGQLRLFTNKHFLSLQTIKELQAIKSYIKKYPNNTGIDYVEQDKRIGLLNLFTGHTFQYILGKQEVYKSYDRFFENTDSSSKIVASALKKIVIFPDSRLSKKDIPASVLQNITALLEQKGKHIQVAKFGTTYTNFKELIQLIHDADYIIGADSLPIHLAALLKKPHFILYADGLTQHFKTIYAEKEKSFGTFSHYDLSNLQA